MVAAPAPTGGAPHALQHVSSGEQTTLEAAPKPRLHSPPAMNLLQPGDVCTTLYPPPGGCGAGNGSANVVAGEKVMLVEAAQFGSLLSVAQRVAVSGSRTPSPAVFGGGRADAAATPSARNNTGADGVSGGTTAAASSPPRNRFNPIDHICGCVVC